MRQYLRRPFTANSQSRVVVEKSDREQRRFHAFVGNHGEFSDKEKSTLQFDSAAAFESFWHTTTDAKRKFEASHEHGAGRVAQTVQNFAASAYDILHHMEPILDLVKDFGAPYGGMAIGTISFFFAVWSATSLRIMRRSS